MPCLDKTKETPHPDDSDEINADEQGKEMQQLSLEGNP
jgi:hypothetical protein